MWYKMSHSFLTSALFATSNQVFSLLALLTHCVLVDSPSVIYWTILYVILGLSGLFCRCISIFVGKPC